MIHEVSQLTARLRIDASLLHAFRYTIMIAIYFNEQFIFCRVETHFCQGYQATIHLGKVVRVNVCWFEMGE